MNVVATKEAAYTGVHIQLGGQGEGDGDFKETKARARKNDYSIMKQILVDGLLNYPYLIIMPCGYKLEYKNFDDIPEEDVSCPCGNPNHWLIRYEDTRRKDDRP